MRVKNLAVKIFPFVAFAGVAVLLISANAMADSYSDLSRQSYQQQEQIRAQKELAQEKAKIDQNNTLFLKKIKWLGQRLHQPITNLVCYDNLYAHGGGDQSQWCSARGNCVTVISEAAYNPYPLSPLSWPGMFDRATAPKRAKEMSVCHFELSSGIACQFHRNDWEENAGTSSFHCLDRSGKTVVDQTTPDDDASTEKTIQPRNHATSTPPEAE
jgi:hypothetical protein